MVRHYSQPGFHDAVRLEFEHAQQQRLLEGFRQALRAGTDVEAQRERLVEFNVSHFQLEELLMEDRGYADFEAHAAEHQWILGLLMACTDDASIDTCASELRRHNGDRDAKLAAFLDGRTGSR